MRTAGSIVGWFSRLFQRTMEPSPGAQLSHGVQRPAYTVTIDPQGFAVVDVETSGLSYRADRVVSLAVVLLAADGSFLGEWSSLTNPGGPVGATHVHGITDEDLVDAPSFHEVVGHVSALLRGRVVVAHNAPFDLGFLQMEFERSGWAWPAVVPHVCTVRESIEFLPHLPRRRLADCAWASGVALIDAHSALGDARAAAQIF